MIQNRRSTETRKTENEKSHEKIANDADQNPFRVFLSFRDFRVSKSIRK